MSGMELAGEAIRRLCYGGHVIVGPKTRCSWRQAWAGESAVSLAVAGGDDMTVIGRGGKLHRAIEEKHGEAKTSVFFLRFHAAPQEPSIPIAARQRPL